jgi:hypothetical protein
LPMTLSILIDKPSYLIKSRDIQKLIVFFYKKTTSNTLIVLFLDFIKYLAVSKGVNIWRNYFHNMLFLVFAVIYLLFVDCRVGHHNDEIRMLK